MGIKLSHSASEKYLTCPQQYKLHYIDRIRPDKLGSALLFGSALDEALNRLLATKMANPPEKIDGIDLKDYATDDLELLKNRFEINMIYHSINKELETKDFVRFRIGISPNSKVQNSKSKINTERFVLQEFSKDEKKIIKQVIKKVVEIIKQSLKQGIKITTITV